MVGRWYLERDRWYLERDTPPQHRAGITDARVGIHGRWYLERDTPPQRLERAGITIDVKDGRMEITIDVKDG